MTIDDGAARAIVAGASLLPAGVKQVEGDFSRGDCVLIRTLQGSEIGRGLVGYDAPQAARVLGRHSRDIAAILGAEGRIEMVHRDDMVLAGEALG